MSSKPLPIAHISEVISEEDPLSVEPWEDEVEAEAEDKPKVSDKSLLFQLMISFPL